MDNFEFRRDRFEAFTQYENPLINLCATARLPDFRAYCKERQLPPFHFLLYCLLMSVRETENFLYRIYEGQMIKIDEFDGGYTVINQDNNVNYARFEISTDRAEFIARSVEAARIASTTRELINDGRYQTPRQRKNNVYVTCMPWLDLRAIEHPIYAHKESDIPSIAIGRFSDPDGAMMSVPICVQAHHGFVDGYHIHLLLSRLASRIAREVQQ